MQSVVNFYKQFNKYKNHNVIELSHHVEPSIQANQYKIFRDDKGIFGFVNWAFLNEENEQHYKSNAKINKDQWQSGDRLWLHDILILRNARIVMSWVYNHFKNFLKTNQCINWLRLDDNNNIYRISSKYKREFHK